MTKMKLSDLKVGDRFTVEATYRGTGQNCKSTLHGFMIDGASTPNYMSDREKNIEVTKLPDPPRDLVKGERIKPNHSGIYGEYIGRDFVWWDEKPFPVKLAEDATTEFYDVISE